MPEVGPPYLHSVAGFTVTAGALLLSSGAAAAEAVEAMLAIAQRAALDDVSVDVTYTDITFSYYPDDAPPLTRIHNIRQRTFNYGKLTDVTLLVERFSNGQLTLAEAEAEIKRLETSRGPIHGGLRDWRLASLEGVRRSSSVAAGRSS